MSLSEWRMSIPFGEGFRRSIQLLRSQFRWFVTVFFVSGVLISLALIPIDQGIATYTTGAMDAIQFFDFFLFFTFYSIVLLLTTLREFIVAFVISFLSCVVIFRILRKNLSLERLEEGEKQQSFPFGAAVSVSFIIAIMIGMANLFPVIIPLVYVFVFFAPAVAVISNLNGTQAIKQSILMRNENWQRILGAFILSFFLNVFAGTVGVMIYRNIETIAALYSLPLGFWGLVLLIMLTQLFVAMVAPLLPLMSIAFYGGGLAAAEADRRRRYLRKLKHIQRRRALLRPFDEATAQQTIYCRNCNAALRIGAEFCHHCGARIGPPPQQS